jgi:hypothetical protein
MQRDSILVILDITRIEGKSLKLNKRSFVLSETIREIIQDLNVESRNFNQKVILSFYNNSSLEKQESIYASIAIGLQEIRQVPFLWQLIYNLTGY